MPPGELGKAVGLDRVPEVRTLRETSAVMADTGTLLPRRSVSRDRLCLRGTTDYWINDASLPDLWPRKPIDGSPVPL